MSLSMMQGDLRPDYYRYADTLRDYLLALRSEFRPFDGVPTLPRQLEVHLPNSGGEPCDFRCKHCQGAGIAQGMALYDDVLVGLVRDLGGAIPLLVFSGAYTEPTLNAGLAEFITEVKVTGSSFGLHTHGAHLVELEHLRGFLTLLCNISDERDYVTISLDAGFAESYARTKQVHPSYFDRVIRGLEAMKEARLVTHRSGPNIRITYLLNRWNSSQDELRRIVELVHILEVDSLRFSIPYAPYGTPYEACLSYKAHHEVPMRKRLEDDVRPFLSTRIGAKPFVSFLSPEFQDVERCYGPHCFYGYFQLTIAADGKAYRCSSCASPTFATHQLGSMPATSSELVALAQLNQEASFQPTAQCKPAGARCNRAAMDVNQNFELWWYGGE